ncbi:hypothetical protein BDK51DRAFT_29945 [Blyttiomyces helicus]|uniref:Heparan-alpha-glucosaminide N-acetyltransferase catalytic domain-containing protein n=1 Tax=Blyttiomyces helicus TaxID=388810 RepID=A0A4P9WNW7_9FUNG|nr:hypothetical protein BDK51DRAFT_29945 [Blyttiomyces helicus]|eukprot:RKO93398.1 hypothetical protein BDK51DRAFT_29945 [Blyttiomyces helicus]
MPASAKSSSAAPSCSTDKQFPLNNSGSFRSASSQSQTDPYRSASSHISADRKLLDLNMKAAHPPLPSITSPPEPEAEEDDEGDSSGYDSDMPAEDEEEARRARGARNALGPRATIPEPTSATPLLHGRSSNQPSSSRPRLVSLDVLRGATIFLMILANYQISDAAFSQLKHAEWIGCTLADVVFPNFLFIMGVRIALVYLACAFAYSYLPWLAFRWLFPTAALLAWTYLSYDVPVTFPSSPICGPRNATKGTFSPPECTAQSQIDRIILGASHLYNPDPFTLSAVLPYDPEGVISTLTAILTGWAGILFGVSLLRLHHRDYTDGGWRVRMAGSMLTSGLASIALGAVAGDRWVPVAKKLWTPSFALVAGGASISSFSLAFWAIEIHGLARGPVARWLVALGRNPLLLYLVSEVVQIALVVGPRVQRDDAGVTLWDLLFDVGFRSWLPPGWSSLAWTLVWMCGVYTPLAVWLDRNRLYWRL